MNGDWSSSWTPNRSHQIEAGLAGGYTGAVAALGGQVVVTALAVDGDGLDALAGADRHRGRYRRRPAPSVASPKMSASTSPGNEFRFTRFVPSTGVMATGVLTGNAGRTVGATPS